MTRPNVLHNISPDQLTPLSDAAPIAVGGIGGSGTRVVARLLIDLGFDMGSDLNESLDDLAFTALFKRRRLWPLENNQSNLVEALQVYLTSRGVTCPPSYGTEKHRTRTRALLKRIEEEQAWQDTGRLMDRQSGLEAVKKPSPNWGWKEPNSHIHLPFLLGALPRMKYIHVIRHGLDMAHSPNQAQLQLWGECLLRRNVTPKSAADSFAFWCCSHERLIRLQHQAKERIMLLRFEDLLENFSSSLQRICDFIGNSPDISSLPAMSKLSPPASIGRRRQHPALSISRRQHDILATLGYDH